jgi:hypothetical protein
MTIAPDRKERATTERANAGLGYAGRVRTGSSAGRVRDTAARTTVARATRAERSAPAPDNPYEGRGLAGLRAWVAEVAALTTPDSIHWCTGSTAENYELTRQVAVGAPLGVELQERAVGNGLARELVVLGGRTRAPVDAVGRRQRGDLGDPGAQAGQASALVGVVGSGGGPLGPRGASDRGSGGGVPDTARG